MERVWRLVIELSVPPGDMSSGRSHEFMNVITWADCCESAKKKITEYLQEFRWQVIGVEDAHVISEDEEYSSEEMSDMISRTRVNPDAIILGTFHTYPTN
jgi:hypothetical protein